MGIVMWDVMEDRDSDDVVDDNEEDQLKYVNVASKILLFQQRIRRYSEIKEDVSTERKTAQSLFKKEISKSVPSIFEKMAPLDDSETNCEIQDEEEHEKLQLLSPENKKIDDDKKFLPSVKVLAAKFTLFKSVASSSKLSVPSALKLKNAFEVKEDIHSITARSISRQFRETLHNARPCLIDRNIKYKPDKNNNIVTNDDDYGCVMATPVVLVNDDDYTNHQGQNDEYFC